MKSPPSLSLFLPFLFPIFSLSLFVLITPSFFECNSNGDLSDANITCGLCPSGSVRTRDEGQGRIEGRDGGRYGTGRQNGKAFDSLLNPTLRPATSHLASLVGFCVAVIVRRRGRGDRLLHFLRDIVVSAVRYLVQTLSLPPRIQMRSKQCGPSFPPSFPCEKDLRASEVQVPRAWSRRAAVSFDPLNHGRRRNEGTKGSRR